MGLEGTVLCGKYRVLRAIGRGGMASVYAAEHAAIRRPVAIKVLQAHLAQNADAVARFRLEAEIAGSLGHDNICDVLDIGQADDGSMFLVMPLLRGRPLSRVLREDGPLAVSRAVDIAVQVLSALSAAHRAGVVHRDLKPDNVFVTKVGDRDDFVKVLDFGISKIVSDDGVHAALTKTGSVLGTPQYMAPEQARGHKDQDHRVDVYASGALLYEMVTGRPPFEGESVYEVIAKIVSDPFPPPTTFRPDLPAAVEAVILQSMARQRDQRFADAEEMADALVAAGRGEAASILPTVPVPGAAAQTASATTPNVSSPLTGTVPPAETTGQSKPRPQRNAAAVAVVAALVIGGGAFGVTWMGRELSSSNPGAAGASPPPLAPLTGPETARPAAPLPQRPEQPSLQVPVTPAVADHGDEPGPTEAPAIVPVGPGGDTRGAQAFRSDAGVAPGTTRRDRARPSTPRRHGADAGVSTETHTIRAPNGTILDTSNQ